MKYEYMYRKSIDKEDFIRLLKKHFALKERTAGRYYRRYKRAFSNQGKYPDGNKKKPDRMKMFKLNDMKRYGSDLSRRNLIKNGFFDVEINWMDDNGYI